MMLRRLTAAASKSSSARKPAERMPAEARGYITFGVFQKPGKLNGFVVELCIRFQGPSS